MDGNGRAVLGVPGTPSGPLSRMSERVGVVVVGSTDVSTIAVWFGAVVGTVFFLWRTRSADGTLCGPAAEKNVAVVVLSTVPSASILSCPHDKRSLRKGLDLKGMADFFAYFRK